MSGPARMFGGSAPPRRSADFRGSAKRLLRQFRPEAAVLGGMVAFGLLGVGFSVLGPKILGDATDLIFAGFVGKRLPDGVSRDEVLDRMRAEGDDGVADMLSGTEFTPGQGIDFGALSHVLLLVVAVYAAAGLMMFVSGRLSVRAISQTVFRLREQVEAKLSRLPLSYFDKQTRGEVLSRVTNDIDNIGQTLQQTMGQIVNSVLTVAGVLVMMFWISPLLALVALVTVPLSLTVATRLGKRAQPQFVRQWSDTGKLNAHVEEMYTGHALVKVFGRQGESAAAFREHNEALYQASYKAQFVSGIMQPAMMFVSNLNYVLVAVAGGLRVA
jgi:ATP-binding cassette, subfamily B, multidrug efflux pump